MWRESYHTTHRIFTRKRLADSGKVAVALRESSPALAADDSIACWRSGVNALLKFAGFACLALVMCACGFLTEVQAGTLGPQEKQDKKKEKEPGIQDWKPAVFPADAIAYGEALHKAAPPGIKAWCEEFARKEMPHRRIDPRETMAVVDKQFPKNSNEARDAAIYLIDYLSYLDEDSNQRRLAGEIRRLDDEAKGVALNMQAIAEQENNRVAHGRTVGQEEMLRNDAKLREMDQQIKEIGERRRERVKGLTTARKRADGYLKVLDVTHKRMNGIEPSVLREFQ